MRALKTDANGDLVVKDGNLELSFDAEACAEACTQAASSLRGEFVFDVTDGVPYMETAFVNSRPAQLEAALRVILSRVPNVLGIEEFALVQNANSISYEAVLNTTFGVISINV